MDCVCYVLIPSAIEKAFLLICETLKKSGASLLNPESEKVMTWSDTGDKVEFVEANIMHEVISGHVKNVQFWVTDSQDVFVSWSQQDEGWRFSIYLDGLPTALAAKLTSLLMEIVLIKHKSCYGDATAFSIVFE